MKSLRSVYVVDDERSVLTGLTRLLSDLGYNVIAFDSAVAFLSDVHLDAPSCALLDMCLPETDGFDVLASLRERRIDLPVIFTTSHADVATCVRAMRAGVIDFLTKPIARSELLAAIARAHAVSVKWHAARTEASLACELLSRLTAREREVLALLLSGRRNKEIACALVSQEATVKVHRSRLMRKLEVRSLVELARFSRYLAPRPRLHAGTDNLRPDDPAPVVEVGRYLAENRTADLDRVPSNANSNAANPWQDAAGTWTAFSWPMRADALLDRAGNLSSRDHRARAPAVEMAPK
jgi:FixJ family two-component response regulator